MKRVVARFSFGALLLFMGLGISGCTKKATKVDGVGAVCAPGEEKAETLLAKVDGKEIYYKDIQEELASDLMVLQREAYKLKKQLVDRKVSDLLLEKAAKDTGKSVDQYREELRGAEVSEAELEAFFKARGVARGEFQPGQIDQVKNYIQTKRVYDRLEAIKEQAKVEYLFSEPKVTVAYFDEDPMDGSKNAPVTIIEFSDFQCPFCSRAAKTMKEVKKKYGDKISIVFKDFPLSFHQNAFKAAEAARCAHQQGKFWPYHDKLFENQNALEVTNLKQYAQELSLDAGKFNECVDQSMTKEKVDRDLEVAKKYGVRSTPTFFINGTMVSGALPLEEFSKVIDSALSGGG